MPGASGPLRIGEFARRVGVSAELLRAWERRYGLLRPIRSSGGFRLYTEEDAERVGRMLRALDQGVSAAQAAAAAIAGEAPRGRVLEHSAERLLQAIRDYDEALVQAVLDESLASFALEAVLRELILPTLSRVGLDWEKGALTVSHEHFATNLIRGRMVSLARLWGRGSGPLALLACVPGEAHDISLVAFGLVLRSHGWRIVFLGADTPLSTLLQAADATRPALAVLSTFDPELIAAESPALRRLGDLFPLALAGPGASEAICEELGVQLLDGDLFSAATKVAGAAGG